MKHTDTDTTGNVWRIESNQASGKFRIEFDPKVLMDRAEGGREIDRLLSVLGMRMHSAKYDVEAALGRAFAS